MTNPDVTTILNTLFSGAGQPAYQPPATTAPAPVVPNPDLASILQSLTGQTVPPAPLPAPQPSIPTDIDLSALLSQFQSPQTAPQLTPPQHWSPPPPSRREERNRDAKFKRPEGSRIKASRTDDVRESVRNSKADQNMYRALCQFYVRPIEIELTSLENWELQGWR